MAIKTKSTTRYRAHVHVTTDVAARKFQGEWRDTETKALTNQLVGRMPRDVSVDIAAWLRQLRSVLGRYPADLRAIVEIESETTQVITVTNTSRKLDRELAAPTARRVGGPEWGEDEVEQ